MVTTLGANNDPAGRGGARIRRRPKNRKELITRAAAEAFSANGYHATSMEAIAGKVGISAPALYRHYPNKYEMFAVVVSMLGQQLIDCTAFVDDVSQAELERDAAAVLDRTVDALITLAIRDTDANGLFRWQGRYLQPADQTALLAQVRTVIRRVQRPLTVLRPELTPAEQWTLAGGLLSLGGSVTGHHLPLHNGELRSLIIDTARALAAAQLPRPGDGAVNRTSVWRIFTPTAGPYESLLNAALLQFGTKGYTETSVSEIADAVGVPASGVYRYLSSKSDILTTGLQRAVDRIAGEMAAIAGVFPEPREALSRLIEAFVSTVFANPELAAVYDTERVNLEPSERELLRDSERAFVDTWTRPIVAIRPELSTLQARFLVHATAVLVDDVARASREDNANPDGSDHDGTHYTQACLRTLMETVLVGGE